MRRGMTLVELLVVIVILVTVLAGVIPMISPNNESRKIREAARQLNTMCAQAQANAAKNGRPYGIAFKEYNLEGMSMEVFFISEPLPFAGFSESSRVSFTPANLVYGPGASGNNGTNYPRYDGEPLFNLTFSIAGGAATPDPIPPRTFKIGDTIEAAGNVFLVADDDKPAEIPNVVEDGCLTSVDTIQCIWINSNGQALASAPAMHMYKIKRQPSNTAGAPLQFPQGIGIDTQASGAEGAGFAYDFDGAGSNVTGIMFGSTGELSAVYFDGVELRDPDRVFLLLGLFENGNGFGNSEIWDFTTNPPADESEATSRKEQVNWLHPGGQIVSIAARSGRVATAANFEFDPLTIKDSDGDQDFDEDGDDIGMDRSDQLSVSRRLARAGESEGGR